MKNKLETKVKASLMVAASLICWLAPVDESQAVVLFSDDFQTGSLVGYTQSAGSTWGFSYYGPTNLIVNDNSNVTGDALSHSFSSVSLGSTDSITFSYDYGWLYGGGDAAIQSGVLMLNSATNSGYMFTVRQGAPGSAFEFFVIQGGAIVESDPGSGTNSVLGGNPLANASFSWDGTTLRGYLGATEVNTYTPTLKFNTFDQITLRNNGGGAVPQFDNLLVTSTIPEPSALALSFGALGLFFLLRFRKVKLSA